jgi:hypothetical protein
MDPLSLAIGVAIGVLGGWVVGRLGKANKLVDRILREETRFRHPSGRIGDFRGTSEDVEKFIESWRARQQIADGMSALSAWSAAESPVHGVNHAWRGQNPTTGIMEADEAAQPEVCGIWRFGPFGEISCQKAPGHKESCDE